MVPEASNRHLARVLEIDRGRLSKRRLDEAQRGECRSSGSLIDEAIAGRIQGLIQEHPTFGYRRIWALLRFREGIGVNRKKVQRIMQLRRWQCTKRKTTPRPRVRRSRSQTARSNERWAMDVTHVVCGADGWGHLVAVIDCHDREIVGGLLH